MKDRHLIGAVVAGLLGLAGVMTLLLLALNAKSDVSMDRTPALNTTEELIHASVIQAADIPGTWRLGGVQIKDAPGATGRFFWFHNTLNPELTWVNVSEKILVYQTQEAAIQAYEGWSQQYFPPRAADAWKQVPELAISHQADQMKIACLPGLVNEIPHLACGAVARYQNVIVVLLGNVFIDRWLTMSDFRMTLEAMDHRIVQGLQSQG